ncbi:MAG: protein-L-isoaspartate(D-aspartate) O-methyltransferase [Bacillota bacterium]
MDFTLKQNQMVKYQLKHRGIDDEDVLDAFLKVPRHEFVDPFYKNVAYEDQPLLIGQGQTISQPYIVARMSEALDIRPGDKVLEVGTGSGFQAAILAQLAKEVHTIENIEPLHHKAKRNIEAQGIDNVNAVLGDGKEGLPSEAPFDKIIVTAATHEIPGPLLKQLKVGGRMIIPLGNRMHQELTVLTKREDEHCKRQNIELCRFVPLM